MIPARLAASRPGPSQSRLPQLVVCDVTDHDQPMAWRVGRTAAIVGGGYVRLLAARRARDGCVPALRWFRGPLPGYGQLLNWSGADWCPADMVTKHGTGIDRGFFSLLRSPGLG